MAQVVLVEPNQTIANLITVNLSNSLGVDIIPRDGASDTIDLLRILPKVDLIITAAKIDAEQTAEQIIEFLDTLEVETPVITIGYLEEELRTKCVNIEKFVSWKEVIQHSAKLLGIDPQKIKEQIRPEYIAQSIHYFTSINSSCCDVFIRIKKGPGEFQFVKRFSAKDTFSLETIDKYIDQGLTHFYIPEADQDRFTTYISNTLIDKLEDAINDKNLDEITKITIVGEAYDSALIQLTEVGFNKSTLNLAESVINGIKVNCQNAPKVGPLLSKVLNSKSSILYQKSHITASIAIEALKGFIVDDKEKLESAIQILTTAAFFNDISLLDQEEHSLIISKSDLNSLNLTDDQKHYIELHSLKSADMIADFPENTDELQTIIREHHGSPDGSELPDVPSNNISNLSKIFFIAEEFAREIFKYKQDQTKTPGSITKRLYERFKRPDFNAVITAIESQLSKKNVTKNS